MKWLASQGLDTTSTHLRNGAGLSRDVRLSAFSLVSLLRTAYNSRYMPEFVSSLSLSGLDGTMMRRFRDDELLGRAHMKTGSLDHVTAIAGYFQARSGERFLVAAIQNYQDVHRGTGEEVQAALLMWLNRR
jgi:D-alanyl-D-alanine carboxypeptidase/D-alanyl-D-alanine-endopeptidase (penicillin-binding protein 4)